ncbi:MAG: hypothetical protein JJT90_04615 [Ectothiorhodospiraceae bacterium]|nr:hypothetical protein [Ectothiorhodospiraceae bacterium]
MGLILLTLLLWGGLLLFTRNPGLLLPAGVTGVLILMEWRTVCRDRGETLIVDPRSGSIQTPRDGARFHLVGALCLPWMAALQCRHAGQRWPVPARVFVVWRDSLPPGLHRALRRWLRQQACQPGAGTTGSV